jgi:hypothetical protein
MCFTYGKFFKDIDKDLILHVLLVSDLRKWSLNSSRGNCVRREYAWFKVALLLFSLNHDGFIDNELFDVLGCH